MNFDSEISRVECICIVAGQRNSSFVVRIFLSEEEESLVSDKLFKLLCVISLLDTNHVYFLITT